MKQDKTILIIEDEKDIRQALRDVLQLKKYKTLEAQNGSEGVDMALANHPDLILLDLIMPGINGMDALAKIREDDWGKNVPVIILTNQNANSEQIIKDMITHKPLEYLIKSDWEIHNVVKKIGEILQNQSMV